MTLTAITTFPKTTHKINTGETSSDYSVKLSLSPHKSSNGTFLDSHRGFIQDPVCKPAVEKDTWSPRLQNNFSLSLWPAQKSASISISPNRFHP